jgi:hypothetical protein
MFCGARIKIIREGVFDYCPNVTTAKATFAFCHCEDNSIKPLKSDSVEHQSDFIDLSGLYYHSNITGIIPSNWLRGLKNKVTSLGTASVQFYDVNGWYYPALGAFGNTQINGYEKGAFSNCTNLTNVKYMFA